MCRPCSHLLIREERAELNSIVRKRHPCRQVFLDHRKKLNAAGFLFSAVQITLTVLSLLCPDVCKSIIFFGSADPLLAVVQSARGVRIEELVFTKRLQAPQGRACLVPPLLRLWWASVVRYLRRFSPSFASAAARLIANVVLPTPPL